MLVDADEATVADCSQKMQSFLKIVSDEEVVAIALNRFAVGR